MKEIAVDISEEGEVSIETRGFKGKACIEESQFLKDVLGKETSKQLTPCYFIDQKQYRKKHLNLCG